MTSDDTIFILFFILPKMHFEILTQNIYVFKNEQIVLENEGVK